MTGDGRGRTTGAAAGSAAGGPAVAGRERRIAMWSGPRNISTAMMRSFGNRADTAVVDEPFYGVYLAATGLDHPGREAVLATMPTDWRAVVRQVTGPVPDGRAVFYQKHMTHHLVPQIGLDWLEGVSHAFLIRDPEAMLASYLDRRGQATLADTGLPQQRDLFRRLCDRAGRAPPVVDADRVLADPEGMLRVLCRALDLPFDPAMLAWPAGRRPTDGVWAPHWYASVERSTGFRRPPARSACDAVSADRPPAGRGVPDALRPLLDACRALHAELAAHALAPPVDPPGAGSYCAAAECPDSASSSA